MRDDLVAKLSSADCRRNVNFINIIDSFVQIAHATDIGQCQILKDCPGEASSIKLAQF